MFIYCSHFHILMNLSITELKVISEIGNANNEISKIAKSLKLSDSQIYRTIQSLRKKGILNSQNEPSKKTHVSIIFKLLSRASNLSIPFSGTGLQIFAELIYPKTVFFVENKTGLHKTTILKKIRQARKMSFLVITKNTYQINDNIWSDAKEFFIELKKYEQSIDNRVPVTSTIYFKNDDEILFSNKNEIDATFTGFSKYSDFGIKIFNITYYYYLPKKELTKKEVFIHSLLITEKEMKVQNLILLALFYIKYRKELITVNHSIINNLKKIFKGEKIQYYPSLQEIKDRAKIYNIKV